MLYVGARGTWYPNFGLSPAQFDMEFHYPANWTLVATGKQVSRAGYDEAERTEAETNQAAGAEKVSRWISERPIPVAGFNLGKYVRAEAKTKPGNILVEAYGTKGVEKSFPKAQAVVEQPDFPGVSHARSRRHRGTPPPPSPARDVQAVADRAAKAIESFSQWFGPYPYGSLALTQMPGTLSQGWPGLVFLSSFAFLSPQEQTDLRLDPVARELDRQVLVHETAHQWWGDLVLWKSYRDQWLAEGLADYAALLLLEQQNPAQFRQILEKYRRDLLSKNKDGEWLRDAGPVTLGQRLESSHFPRGIRGDQLRKRHLAVSHAAFMMLRDSETASRSRKGRANPRVNPEEPFFRALRKIRERYAGKSISTQELVQVFRRGTAAPTLVRETSQVGLVLGRLDRRDGDSGAGSSGDPHDRKSRSDHGYGRGRTKGCTRRSGDGGPGVCDNDR